MISGNSINLSICYEFSSKRGNLLDYCFLFFLHKKPLVHNITCGVHVSCLSHPACSLLNIVLITQKFMKKTHLAMKMFTHENKHVDLTTIS